MRWELGLSSLARLCALFGVCGVLGAACGGNSEGGGGGYSGGPIAIEQLPGAMADAFCDMLAPCCQSVGIPISASCRENLETNLRTSFESANPDNYEYDANAAGDCINRIRQLGDVDCTGSTMNSNSTNVTLSCNEAIIGKLEPGAACASDIECAVGTGEEVDCDGGICVVDRRGVAGDSCYWTCTDDGNGGTSCSGNTTLEELPDQSRCFINDGLYCADSGVCTAQSALGGACDGDDACGGDTRCDYASSTCVARSPEGAACTFDECATGLYCKNDVCVPELAPGSPCVDFEDECRDGFCDEGICAESTGLGNVGIALMCALIGGGGFTVQPQQP